MNLSFKKATQPLRYSLIKLLSPSLRPYLCNQRPMDNFLISHYTEPLIGVEVGVYHGNHAKQMLRSLKLSRLYLVDAYLPFIEDHLIVTKEETERNFLIAKQQLNQYQNIKFLKMLSVEAAKIVPNDLDFVYVDATHYQDAVTSDINSWYPKVRVGGVIGGHDFTSDFLSVVRAVTKFATENKLKLNFYPPDWWLIKGETNESLFS